MPQYLLLLRDDGSRDWAAEELQHVLQRYGAWFDNLRQSGSYVGGNKLRDLEGRVMKKNGSGIAVTDGPYTESKEVLGGYFVLDAPSYDEAIKLTKDCPHFDYGTIEVRLIENMRKPNE